MKSTADINRILVDSTKTLSEKNLFIDGLTEEEAKGVLRDVASAWVSLAKKEGKEISAEKKNLDILELKDKYGNVVRVMKTPVIEGDRVVIVDDLKNMTLLSHIPSQRAVISKVTRIIDQGASGGRRVKIEAMGGSWHEDCVYQIVE